MRYFLRGIPAGRHLRVILTAQDVFIDIVHYGMSLICSILLPGDCICLEGAWALFFGRMGVMVLAHAPCCGGVQEWEAEVSE